MDVILYNMLLHVEYNTTAPLCWESYGTIIPQTIPYR